MKHIIVALGLSLFMGTLSGTALGNPVSCEFFKAQWIPQSNHVQLTFGDQCAQNIELLSLTRDGETVKPDWQAYEEYLENMGSGVDKVNADQTCDCDVAVGTHVYKLAFKMKYEGKVYSDEFSSTVDVSGSAEETTAALNSGLRQQPDTQSADEATMPWTAGTEEIQGLDCIAACASGGPGTEEAASDGDGMGCSVVRNLGDTAKGGMFLGGVFLLWCLFRLTYLGRRRQQ